MFQAISQENIFKNMFGTVTVEQKQNTVELGGLNADRLFQAFTKTWGTSRIQKNVYKRENHLKVSFMNFFVPDVIYMLEAILPACTRFGLNYNKVLSAIEQLKTETWLGEANLQPKEWLDYKRLDKLVMPPLPEHMNFFKTYEKNKVQYGLKGYLLAAAAGTGKTFMGIATGQLVNADVCIYIVPANSVVDVWEKTLDTVFKQPEAWWSSRSNKPLHTNYKHYVFHYETLQKAMDFFRMWPGKAQKRFFVDLDESHNFNDVKSDRTQNLVQLTKLVNAQDVIFSSGTPFKALGQETIPLMRCIDPWFIPVVEESYRKTFGQAQNMALEILAIRLGRVKFELEKANMVKNELIETKVQVRMDNAHDYTLAVISAKMSAYVQERKDYYDKEAPAMIKQYHEIVDTYGRKLHDPRRIDGFNRYKTYARMIADGYDPVLHKHEAIYCNLYERKEIIPALPNSDKIRFRNVKSVYKYVMLKIHGEALGRILGSERTRCNVEMALACDTYSMTDPMTQKPMDLSLKQIVEGAAKKTIIFTSFVEVVYTLEKKLKEQGFRPMTMTADESKDLPKVVKRFEQDPMANPLITTYKMLSTAVPLIMANTIVLANSPFRSNEREQTISRANRLGQTHTVYAYDLFLDTGDVPNISTRSGDILEWSKKQVAAIMGHDFDEVTMESFVDDVLTMEAYHNVMDLIASDNDLMLNLSVL